MSSKTQGWEKRLAEYVAKCAQQKFKPGKLDCGLFFFGGVEVMTGRDLSVPFRGKYRTIEGAMKIARKLGFDDHVEYTASILEERPSPLMAQRGDGVVVDDMNGFPALGIVQGESIYLMGLNGIGTAPLTVAKRAFIV